MTLPTQKKLLVLDMNGLLVETFHRREKKPRHRRPDGRVGKLSVYRRPYCNEFLKFCFENFEVGIWSSAKECNVQNLVDFIFGDLKSKLVFYWHQNDCTDTGLRTLENKFKPMFLKELYKLWDTLKLDLAWKERDYGPFNTLLIDDTPYKAMRNPLHTAIFPYPYKVSNEPDDILGGVLLKYLEGISAATNVQHYVAHHQFGQPPISSESLDWHFYRKILSIRLPPVNRNSSSVVRTKMNEVSNKTLTYNNDATHSSSIQEGSVPSIEREGKSVTQARKSKKKKRKAAAQAALSQEHKAHNISPVEKEVAFGISQQSERSVPSIERKEKSVTKARKSKKKRRKIAMQAALSQEHEAHNISPEEKEVAFDISQQSEGSVPSIDREEKSVTKARKSKEKKRKSVMQASLSQEHEAHNIFPVEKEVAFGISQQSEGSVPSIEREEKSVTKARKHKKKKRKSVVQSALSQEHEAHNISPVEKEVDFGISQQADPVTVLKDGLSEIAGTCVIKRNGAITTLIQKHATLNVLAEDGVDNATKPKKKNVRKYQASKQKQ